MQKWQSGVKENTMRKKQLYMRESCSKQDRILINTHEARLLHRAVRQAAAHLNQWAVD